MKQVLLKDFLFLAVVISKDFSDLSSGNKLVLWSLDDLLCDLKHWDALDAHALLQLRVELK